MVRVDGRRDVFGERVGRARGRATGGSAACTRSLLKAYSQNTARAYSACCLTLIVHLIDMLAHAAATDTSWRRASLLPPPPAGSVPPRSCWTRVRAFLAVFLAAVSFVGVVLFFVWVLLQCAPQNP